MATQHPISGALDCGERVLSLTAYTGRLALRPKGVLGSFSIDDGNGSENVSFKMNWEVKMAGYWSRSFFAFLLTSTWPISSH